MRPKSSGTDNRGGSTTARPAAASRSGPSLGATTITRAPRRTPVATAVTSAGSAASSPATTTTSSAPIHGGTSGVTTSGIDDVAPSAAASTVPAAPGAPDIPRPHTQVTVRGR
ncbi:Uncharacterised protein [Mycobacteroides abscessus subsp. abscessus]|nr:Uncharacterised protein [Mycobacteroides abscessus subsp. abscessus]